MKSNNFVVLFAFIFSGALLHSRSLADPARPIPKHYSFIASGRDTVRLTLQSSGLRIHGKTDAVRFQVLSSVSGRYTLYCRFVGNEIWSYDTPVPFLYAPDTTRFNGWYRINLPRFDSCFEVGPTDIRPNVTANCCIESTKDSIGFARHREFAYKVTIDDKEAYPALTTEIWDSTIKQRDEILPGEQHRLLTIWFSAKSHLPLRVEQRAWGTIDPKD